MDPHVTIECRGHPAITGTHAKTWELTLDDEIGRRATCVVGVSSVVDWDRLLAIRGPVRLTLSVGDRHDEVRAEMNPLFRAGRSLVVRTSRFRADDTVAVAADKSSADLDRDLISALARPEARLVVEIVADPAVPHATAGVLAVLAVASGAPSSSPSAADLSPRLAGLIERAAVVLRADARWNHAAAGEALARGGLVCVLVPDRAPPAVVLEALAAMLRAGVEQGAEVAATPGWGALAAALALAGPPAPGCVTVDATVRTSARERRARVAIVLSGGWPTAWSGPAIAVRRMLDVLAELAPSRPACLITQQGEPLARIVGRAVKELAAELPGPRQAGSEHVVVVVAGQDGPAGESPASGSPGSTGSTAEMRRFLAALVGEGVSPRTLRRALDREPGLASGWSYQALAALRDDGGQRGVVP